MDKNFTYDTMDFDEINFAVSEASFNYFLNTNEKDSYTEEDYDNLPANVRAELIDGQFYYMCTPSRIHQQVLISLSSTIFNYIKSKGGPCEVYPAPFAVKLNKDDNKSVFEPDISVICDRDKLTDRGCTGAPDWIIEIVSPSNPSHDYVRKLNKYMAAGVREYWIVDPKKQSVSVFHFETDDKPQQFCFADKIKVNIYDDLLIDFQDIDLS